jgi:hypothetical protein
LLFIYTNIFKTEFSQSKPEDAGKQDVTLEIYGWKQLGYDFQTYLKSDIAETLNIRKLSIVASRWFTLAHIDYYLAKELGMNVIGIGKNTELRNYLWTNKNRKELKPGEDALYFTTSKNFVDPTIELIGSFENIELLKTFPILRNNRICGYGFLYLLQKYR